MTEAERLRAQADRCTQLAKQIRDRAIAGALIGLAASSFEKATELERAAIQRRRRRMAPGIGPKLPRITLISARCWTFQALIAH